MKSKRPYLLLILCLALLAGCQTKNIPNETPAEPPSVEAAAEIPVQYLTLDAPLDTPKAEISAMTWAGDWLILVPQYPSRFDDQLFRIHKDDILEAVENKSETPLPMETIQIETKALKKEVKGFEGFEALVFDENTAYFTVESQPKKMQGYAIMGSLSDDYSRIELDLDSLTELDPQADLDNMTDESILVFGRRILTIYEANGKNVNPSPTAYLLDLELQPSDTLSFPNIEYRITDVSSVDDHGCFWAINYFYPGDVKLEPAEDNYLQSYEQGPTHSKSAAVERLIELQFSEDGIIPTDTAPIQLELLPDDDARNWEGLARLDDLGFLLVTDTYPETLLGFVPYPAP